MLEWLDELELWKLLTWEYWQSIIIAFICIHITFKLVSWLTNFPDGWYFKSNIKAVNTLYWTCQGLTWLILTILVFI